VERFADRRGVSGACVLDGGLVLDLRLLRQLRLDTASGGASLVDENGTWVLWVVAALILCAVVFWFALRRQWLVLGWTLAIAVLVLSVISFGLIVFTLPLALLMIIAAATFRGPDEQRV
jgi:hypothetical protein